MNTDTFRLTVKANQDAFELVHTMEVISTAPAGHPHNNVVSASIIGYWIDIEDSNGSVLYRRFLHYLPHNLAKTWQEWSKHKRQKACYQIDIPKLEHAYEIGLYEQKIVSPTARQPTRTCHFKALLRTHVNDRWACNQSA